MEISATTELPPLKHPWQKALAVGRGYELLRADLQKHLRFLKREFNYQHVRFHASFHDDVAVVHKLADGRIVYRWTQLDHIYDFLVEEGFEPIVEINPMPKALASGDTTFFWYKMNITPPRSYQEWQDFIAAVTTHFVERYGLDTVRKWYFEVWNEPNLRHSFWDGTQEEYFELYTSCARAVKGVHRDLRIGGPSGAGNFWNLQLARYCQENDVPLDFISYHAYPVGEAGSEHGVGMDFVNHMTEAKKQLQDEGYGDLPILMTEWNSQTQDKDKKTKWVGNEGVNSLHAGAAVCHYAYHCDDLVDMFTWWVASDVFEEGGPQVEPYGTRFQYYGMLTIDGLPKSSFHAFRFLSRMKGDRYAVTLPDDTLPTQHVLLTDEITSTRLMAWNFVLPFEEERQWSFSLDLPVPAVVDAHATIRVTRAQVTKGQGSAYEFWQEMGTPANLTRCEQEALAVRAQPAYESRMEPVTNGKVRQEIVLGPNEFVFIEVGGEPAGGEVSKSDDQKALDEALQVEGLE